MSSRGDLWSYVPQELLEKMAESLNSRFDILRLRAVCPSWRSSVPNHFPPPLLPVLSMDETSSGHNIALTEYKIYRADPIQKNPNTHSYLFQLKNGRHPFLLAPLPVPITSPGSINLLDYRVSEISKAYVTEEEDLKIAINTAGDVMKLKENDDETDDVLYLLRSGDDKWRQVGPCGEYWDVIAYKDKFYADSDKGTIVIDPCLNDVWSQIESPPSKGVPTKPMFVESSLGCLLLVYNYPKIPCRRKCNILPMTHVWPHGFKVYKLDEEKQTWVKTKSLGDEALFIDKSRAFTIPARDFSGYKKNRIYYFKRNFTVFNLKYGMEESDHGLKLFRRWGSSLSFYFR